MVTFSSLKNINMDIKSNAITALIGPSVCGSLPFIKSINRMNDLIEAAKINGNIFG